MSFLDSSLLEARTADGRRRFYAPGEHPCTDRVRVQLQHLADMAFDRSPVAERLRADLAAFEEQHSDAKAEYFFKARERRL